MPKPSTALFSTYPTDREKFIRYHVQHKDGKTWKQDGLVHPNRASVEAWLNARYGEKWPKGIRIVKTVTNCTVVWPE